MPPRRWSRRAAPRVAAKPPTALPGCTPEDQVLRLTCALCAREARGFGYIHQLRIGEFPHYRFCSMACSKAGSALARRMGGMIDKTPLEEAAIKAARRPLAEVLQELGLLAAFHDRSAAEIDRIIEACVDGFQDAMQRNVAERDPFDDPIPFGGTHAA